MNEEVERILEEDIIEDTLDATLEDYETTMATVDAEIEEAEDIVYGFTKPKTDSNDIFGIHESDIHESDDNSSSSSRLDTIIESLKSDEI